MEYNLWQKLILGATKPFRTGANILAQNWGSALTGKDMSQRGNQGRFLRWLSEGITPEEQQVITEKPYLSALKSGAGMASTLAPFASQGLRTAQLAANPLANRIAQLTSQGALEGSLGGFGLSREGKEVQDTLTGGLAGAGGELFMDYLTNPQFRNMLTDATTTISPRTGARMYKGELGSNEDVLDTLNPTGGLTADYTPDTRVKARLGKNITTLDKTMGRSADEMITVYRGASNSQGKISPGDFITTNEQLARDYAGTGRVIKERVRLGDILDDLTEPLGEEYIYRPQYLYHGTGEGAFRNIRKEGLIPREKGKYIYFSDTEDYAKTYAQRKGSPFGERILRVKKTPEIIGDVDTGLKGDFKTLEKIDPKDIEVKVGDMWVKIQDYFDEALNINPISNKLRLK